MIAKADIKIYGVCYRFKGQNKYLSSASVVTLSYIN